MNEGNWTVREYGITYGDVINDYAGISGQRAYREGSKTTRFESRNAAEDYMQRGITKKPDWCDRYEEQEYVLFDRAFNLVKYRSDSQNLANSFYKRFRGIRDSAIAGSGSDNIWPTPDSLWEALNLTGFKD